MDVHKGGPAMLISRKACTVVVTLIVTLVTTVSVALAQQGRPDTQAFLVKDIDDSFNTAAGSSPGPFVEAGGTVFFTANDGTSAGLWRTDGTAAGTVMVKALGAHDLTNVNGTLFFASGFSPFSTFGSDRLWKSDGTAAGTVLVVGDSLQPPPPLRFSGFTAVNGTLFFVQDLDRLFSLWRSDGTTEGTVLVKDINPGAGNSLPSSLTNVNGTLFFAAFHPDLGTELWKSDGTEAGTVLVKDISPGAASSGPSNLTNVNGTLFFTAFRPETGYELWKSDGTEQGTVLVKDVTPGPDSSGATPLIGVNGVLFFRTSNPLGLWRTDGTEAGTALIREGIFPLGPSYPNRCGGGLAAVNNLLVFVVQRGACELWRSDGVTADFLIELPGAGNALRMVSGLVLFSVYDSAHGRELWATDGTSVGMVQDIAPGPAWSSPSSFTPVGPLVFFQANDHVTGAELWAMSKSAIHRTLNLPEPSPDVAAQEGPSPKRREPANESRAFLPAFEDDPDELVASERETP